MFALSVPLSGVERIWKCLQCNVLFFILIIILSMCGKETIVFVRPFLRDHFDSYAYYAWRIVRISLEVSDSSLGSVVTRVLV